MNIVKSSDPKMTRFPVGPNESGRDLPVNITMGGHTNFN